AARDGAAPGVHGRAPPAQGERGRGGGPGGLVMRRRLLLGLALLAGCGTPRQAAPPPPAPAYGAVSSVHYRDLASADNLAAYLRWRPGAPVLVSAHRGGPRPGLPENALATFEYALNFAPALLETDVRRTADG